MKNAVKSYTFLTLVFIALYIAAGMLGGIAYEVVCAAAFAVPVALGYALSQRLKREREELAGVAEREPTLFGISAEGIGATFAMLAPFVAVVFLISYLTSLLLGALGFAGNTVADAPLHEMLLVHALVPAVLEEMMFRYLPMKLIAPYSRRWCVVLSALYFALIHMNLFQIPYALFAGVVFVVIDLAYESVLPSLILHFLNNAVSVLWIKWSADAGFALWYVIIMAALAMLSLIPLLLRRREYLSRLRYAFSEGEILRERTAPMMLTAFCLIMAAFNLFA